ncbi:Vacuolar protein sorting-associated protein 13 [Phytophthora ramorum]|nr:Vacuolar protein sorting-associated protein 13 [Phytophthora ramorum]
MLEGALKSWIAYFLGQYVESHTVNVSAKLWQSSERLKLENLTLKSSVVPSWLPFRLKTGFIGLFEADLPISAIFGNASAKIKFQDVLLVLAPLQQDEDELQDEISVLVEHKMRKLEQDLQDRWNGPQVPEYTVPHESEGYFGTDGWIGRTMTKLIDNLQVDIRNLHIRVEGTWVPSGPMRSPPTSRASTKEKNRTEGVKFAVGITLGALSAVTTPSNWRVGGFDDQKDEDSEEKNHLVFKLINAIDLSAYVDPNALHFIHSRVHPKVLQSTLSRLKEMGSRAAKADWWNAEESVHAHRFLVAPINVALKLTMNTAAQHAQTDDPRYDAVFHLSRIWMTLDEEQLSVLNLIIDSFSRHEKWRLMVAEQVKASERHTASNEATMAELAEDYLLLWNQVMVMKNEGMDALRKSEAWIKVTKIEQLLPYEVVVSIRNRLGLEMVKGKIVPYPSKLYEVGDVLGIPLPEISVPFPEGPTGLLFDLLPSGDVTVKRCADKSPAATKDSVKPGLLLIKVDDRPLRSVFKFKSGLDVELAIDSMPGTKVLTFRHPSVMPLEVTPSRAVAQVSFSSDQLKFCLVRAFQKQVIAEVMLDHPVVSIRGFGPSLFSYHFYEVVVEDFYIQSMSRENDIGNHCIASSICNPGEGLAGVDAQSPALQFSMNYLYDTHPDARQGYINTYGSKISLAIGNSIAVFDEAKMTALLGEWHDWVGAISSDHSREMAPPSVPRTDADPAAMSQSITSQLVSSYASTSPSNIALGDEMYPPVEISSYSYEVKVDLLRLFISAPEAPTVPVEISNEPSYRALLKQLVGDEPGGPPAIPDWARAAHAIVVMQRFIRGAIVRKRKMVRLALARNRWIYYQGSEMMGWMYTRDDSLAFRRWRRSWCHLDDDGNFSMHSNGSGADVLDEFSLLGCKVIMLPYASGGPWSDNLAEVLEITTRSGILRKVLSSDNLMELKKWKHSIESSARNAAKRSVSEDVEDEEVLYDSTAQDEEEESSQFRKSERWDASALDELLLGGFSSIYRPVATLKKEQSSWISLSITDVNFVVDVHRVSEPDRSAFALYLGLKDFTALDHRQSSEYGLLHIGDKFLSLKNGKLTPGKMRADHLSNGPFLMLRMSYRGARAGADCFVIQTGVHADLTISGWVMPLTLTQILFEVIGVLDVLWADNIDKTYAEPAGTAPWREVPELAIQIRAPILEAYLEDSHCVAKLTIEDTSCSYRADPGVENFKLHLGPTALFVLTEDVALRLVQVDKLWISYDLRLHRQTDSAVGGCDLCADDSPKRPVCHRSVSISIGQVKLEADRRLELLFALLEALTYSETPAEAEGDAEFDSANEEKAMDSDRDGFDRREYGVSFLGDGHLSQTERLQSMQISFQDPDSLDLRPMYTTGFSRPYASPSGRSRMSTATSAGLNYGLQDNARERSKRQPKVSVFIPLLNYQSLVGISSETLERQISSSRSIFRTRLRIGRIHDRLSITCYSVVFEVIKRSLSVVSLDTYIPVMNFSMSDMKMQCVTRTEFSTDYVVDASVEISARYYNTSLADWEPFIEPWRAYGKARSKGGEDGTTMQLSALQRLNVNCTDSLIRLLSSIAKNRRKQDFIVEKRTLAAVAADGEAKKEDGRVCVLNNLGVPIRLANLNTSHAGTLHVDVRDGWSFPGYSRFHNVRVSVVLLPWWHPREMQAVENFRHKFSLPYGGAQSGVTPILRIDVLTTDERKRNYVFDHVTNKYVEVEVDDEDDYMDIPAAQRITPPNTQHMDRGDSTNTNNSQRTRWSSVGSAEINLAGNVMASLDPNRMRLNRWYRLHDLRGNVTGEIFVGLQFVPDVNNPVQRTRVNEPQQVKDGQFLVFDPLKIVTANASSPTDECKDHAMLSDGLRGSYIPPLALEVMIGASRMSLMCPLRRAGKFLIQGEKVLAEVKVAQRDESRRVLLLSSPVQLKNDTSIDMELWTCRTRLAPGESGALPRMGKLMTLTASNKMSVPISAMFGDEKDSVVVKVDGCKPTVVADLNKLAAGSTILTLEAEDAESLGYCLYVNITSHMRKVYREEHQEMITRGNTNQDGELQTYATKYQISLHSCLMFENTLPIRVQYKIVASGLTEEIIRTGTLSPGEEVPIHDFQLDACLILRLPEMDSIWSRPINLGDCIYRDGMDRSIKSMLGAIGAWDPIVEFLPSPQSPGIAFKEGDISSNKVITRIDHTAADDGSPRIVLFCSLWVYNQSHVQTLLFRCADNPDASSLVVPQLVPQRPVPRLMDCPGQVFEIGTIIDTEVSRWSDKIHTTVVGVQEPISLKFGSKLGPKTRNELGISIQRPLGQFHRTTQVIITSHFVFVNKTRATFKVSQYMKTSDRVVELPAMPAKGNPSSHHFDFDAATSLTNRRVYLRMDHHGAEWSGPFAVDEENEFSLKLNGSVMDTWRDGSGSAYKHEDFRRSVAEMYRVKVRISNMGPSMVVTLLRDDPPMYVIRNESSSDVFVNQVHCSDETVVIRSKEFIPFAWVKPDGPWRVACRTGSVVGRHEMISRNYGVYDFANLDRERNIDALRYRMFGSKSKTVSGDIVVDRASRVLVFRDYNPDKPPSYILEVKIVAARLRNEFSLKPDSTAELIAETDNHEAKTTESKELKTAHVYRFDSDLEFACDTRPKKLTLNFYETQGDQEDVIYDMNPSSIGIDDESYFNSNRARTGNSSAEIALDATELAEPGSPRTGEDSTSFEMMHTPAASPVRRCRPLSGNFSSDSMVSLPRNQGFYRNDSDLSYLDGGLQLSDVGRVSDSYASSEQSDEEANRKKEHGYGAAGTVEIKIPKKAWTKLGVGAKRSIALSYNTAEQARRSLGRVEGHWWEMRDPETGDLVGEVLVALKFRTSVREHIQPTGIYNMSVIIPSIGLSFLHNANSNMVEVAYLSMQRLGLLYSCAGGSSEVVFSLGNLQMDNQMEREVVLGPKVHRVKEGVSVRLRDRWRSFMNYRYRGIFEEIDTNSLSVIQFRMLWNSSCHAGEFTHYELIELIMQELEVSTDEKFVVNLISVFQGLEGLTSHHTFEEIVNTQLDYAGGFTSGVVVPAAGVDERSLVVGAVGGGGTTTTTTGTEPSGVYIEELSIEAVRIKFSMELHGGRFIKTLGPSGRRLAVYLPESNVKDFRLYLTKLSFTHLYEPQASVVEKVTRRYSQQAVILVLSGLHTVSVYANPFRIVYRLGHGVVELVRLPARGLASGSPLELISGAYLGVRSLAMNTISASYEIVAGATGILGAVLTPFVPEGRRKAFEEDLVAFQRAVIEEVDAFDAAEERTMTKVIVRKPREFDAGGVGLLTVYGPGSVPQEEQERIDHKAVVLLQLWWRRRRRAKLLLAEARRLRPEPEDADRVFGSSQCAVQ